MKRRGPYKTFYSIKCNAKVPRSSLYKKQKDAHERKNEDILEDGSSQISTHSKSSDNLETVTTDSFVNFIGEGYDVKDDSKLSEPDSVNGTRLGFDDFADVLHQEYEVECLWLNKIFNILTIMKRRGPYKTFYSIKCNAKVPRSSLYKKQKDAHERKNEDILEDGSSQISTHSKSSDNLETVTTDSFSEPDSVNDTRLGFDDFADVLHQEYEFQVNMVF
ncbi:hypothetical protein TSAR_010935 [Trichomalopsis sarcophagae]|uniref:Uncharacterized protein n=1 Tax=Trichomalopsis sarcophagae TaxID=543379 RepID=A0A232ED54_9HYME|nr:hypothetical protein TSAR_010935 [Trichomalopsis sarcophagae]